MRSNNPVPRTVSMLLLLLLMLLSGCGGGGGAGPSGPTLTSLTVTPNNSSIAAGSTQQFVATGTFSDGTTQNLTTQVSWSSSAPSVIQIASTTGLASAIASGTATITATVGSAQGTAQVTVTGGSTAATNVMAITVDGSLCSSATSASYLNKPCVSVTVCTPDSTSCQTVSDILLDTGSYGLRIFKQAIPGLALPQVVSGTGSLAECIQFADGSTIWGPVKMAAVQLGGEAKVQVPIQVIDSGFATPTSCGTPDPDPISAGYSGVLGIGPLAEDCGTSCANLAQIGIYFSCTGLSCIGATVALANQVRNPVASLPAPDNNGVLVQLPAVPLGGVPSLSGSLILGIGTQANNTPTLAPTVIPTNRLGDFSTTLTGATGSVTSFVDTGSNALFFPSSLPLCSGVNSAWYCPPTTTPLSATMVGAFGSPTQTVSFNIGNFSTLLSTNNKVFSEIGGPSTFGFDWGLPFFMGRNVFIGINGVFSPGFGTGPFVAF